MSKVECTAVNELIDLVHQKPLIRDSEDDLFTAPRAARLRGTEPPALFAVELPALPAPLPRGRRDASPMPQKAPLHLTGRSPSQVDKYVPLATLAKRWAMPVIGLVTLGIVTGIIYTIASRHGDTGPSPAQVAFEAAAAVPPLPAPAPTIVPVAPPAPTLVDVRLDSTPPGAQATLLSNGISTPLGSTPVEASVDPTKSYDVVFAIDGQPSKVEHLDPATTQHIEVAFTASPPPTVAVKSKSKSKKSKHRAPAARVAAAAPAQHHKTTATAATPDPGVGNGTLAITTNPPCAILIDDQNTGLTTPQRAIPVPAGHHNVRLIAATIHVNKLVPVDITAHHTSRINQDFAK